MKKKEALNKKLSDFESEEPISSTMKKGDESPL